MDMLSTDPPSSIYGAAGDSYNSYNEVELLGGTTASHIGDENTEIMQHNGNSLTMRKRQRVVHLPANLTLIQNALIHLILELFSETLLSELKTRENKPSIESLLEVSSMQSTISAPTPVNRDIDPNNSIGELIDLCFEKLAVVNNQPTLLVDHFIPKKLILSETNELQSIMSGKYELLNEIVDALIEDTRASGELYPILVIAKSNKELELIEGMIIGKDLRYSNSSNLKLYEDGRKFHPGSSEGAKGVCINLIQSSQLYNNYLNQSFSVKYRFIYSFDFNLDATNPSIEMLQSDDDCPIFIPVPVFSTEHLQLHLEPEEPQSSRFINDDVDGGDGSAGSGGTGDGKRVRDWKVKILHSLVVNSSDHEKSMNRRIDNFYYDSYGANMGFFISNIGNPEALGALMKDYDNQLIQSFSNEKLKKRLKKVDDAGLLTRVRNGVPLTRENFNREMSRVLHLQLYQVNDMVRHAEEVEIPKKRKFETSRQVHFDEDEDSIAENYRKFQKLNEEAMLDDRKLARLENEVTKNEDKIGALDKKLEDLQSSVKDDNFAKEATSEQKQQELIKDLQNELEDLSREYTWINNEIDEARLQYQQSSTNAVAELHKLNKLKTQKQAIEDRISGPGMVQLPDLIHSDTLASYEQRLTRLKAQNKFLSGFFNSKISHIYTERQQITENSGSSGSSTRPSNRISRDSTPL
ncbi:uncharacterized protein LODBEIA_P33800 [Lodderomyces beijingensis]|uniref:HDA1 complex subunit 2 n=1 Tax=Lodderomyces beijingensis TaxID=1775926 RepID=A0ABP0ZPW6_9ASCO